MKQQRHTRNCHHWIGGLLLILALLSGCSNAPTSDSKAASTTPPSKSETKPNTDADAKAKAEAEAKAKADADAKAKADAEAKAKADADRQAAAEKLKTYLKENFGGNGDPKYATSWYASIKDVLVYPGDVVQVMTDLYQKDSNKKNAQAIANAVLLNSEVPVKTVNVSAGQDDKYFYTKDKN